MWTIRRWTSDIDADVAITWGTREVNLGGSGVTGVLFINDEQVDGRAVMGGDSVGYIRTVYTTVAAGDTVDLALTPVNRATNSLHPARRNARSDYII